MPDEVKLNDMDSLNWVGTRPARPDGVDKVTGKARFGADLSLPGMLHGRVLRSPHAHATPHRSSTPGPVIFHVTLLVGCLRPYFLRACGARVR